MKYKFKSEDQWFCIAHLFLNCWPECIGYAELEQAWKYMTICCISFHPCRSIRKDWPCHKYVNVNPVSSYELGSTWVPDAVYQVSRSSALGSKEGDFWRFLPYIGLEVILVTWQGIFAHFFIPTSHGGSIWNLSSNSHVFFEEKKFENVESEWPWKKVTEWPWPWVFINRYVLIYLTICTSFRLTGFNSFLEIYSLSIFLIQKQKGPNLTLL